ncbi:DUF2267 domain-containing protein [Natrinema salifodinae]|uniref:Uncharacterized conserved protein, DUF2267 family n=1 Tax=Natrinema salifodinae TaxID=1202768 RepID=A0A1I0QKZ8_9EURY|nr:DUF2267 domain-containing protein [Natrinema salifodinae]SEW27741.1 Uncharacterized conserved protein, DUF2267 family [Natrinema salifodinae]
MERHDFYQAVERQATLSDEADARDATQAVLSALGERVDETRLQRIDGELPDEIGDHLTDGASGRSLSYDEFLERVAERTDRAAVEDPERLARAVVGTLLEHIDEDEADGLRERLDELGFEAIVPESGPGATS